MARRGEPLTLQGLTREEICKLTLIALDNILQQEKEDEMCHGKQLCQGKKNHMHCYDGRPQVNLPDSKKPRTAGDHVVNTTTKGKRGRKQDQEDADTVPMKRRKGADELSWFNWHASSTNCNQSGQEQRWKDDVSDQCCMFGSEGMEAIKHYFSDLTPSMWTVYGNSLIDKVIRKMTFEPVDQKILERTIEHIFCAKLLTFSTLAIERYSGDLEKVIFGNLMKCIRLDTLEVTMVPSGMRDTMAASFTLQRLKHIHSLSLLPSSRYSYHWVVSHLARHCQTLRELKMVYNGDLFDRTNELTSLQKCSRLTFLWLFNFGRNSETSEVSQLIKFLGNLKVLYHKELPNAILELQNKRGTVEQTTTSGSKRHLLLERVDLCWHQRAIGYQLVYVPSSYLSQVAKVCPQIRVLNLVGPPCLAHVLQNLPHVHVLILQQASLTSCLAFSLNNLGLDRITELRVTDVWDVTHDIISAIACSCPHLEVLNIINSSLEAQGDLQVLSHRPPFPHLRQITLVPVMIHNRPPLTTPSVWQLGAQLTSYLLGGASQLTDIHFCYKLGDILEGDIPSAQHLEDALSCLRPTLRSLNLEWPPAVFPRLVGIVMRACPALTKLTSIITWPLTSDQRAAIVMDHGRSIDIT
ncbi:hypothetical protein GWK47_005058 [Chionoecetes opilio]|uniref:Uncharacterized protein n=1 Tax=Chionoecetes opilio TaxID=41210 RepID=A0A8J4YIL0_CHIOP|nr:hypothetical protein GWK47_005058 [Chionoecetes opilio]